MESADPRVAVVWNQQIVGCQTLKRKAESIATAFGNQGFERPRDVSEYGEIHGELRLVREK